MRTSIVHRDYSGVHRRDCGPEDVLPPNCKSYSHPKFQAAHCEEVYPMDMRSLTIGKKTIRKRDDAIHVGCNTYHFKRGRAESVRRIAPEFVEQMDKIDEQIQALRQQLREVTEDAYMRGNPITLEEAKNWTTPQKATQP